MTTTPPEAPTEKPARCSHARMSKEVAAELMRVQHDGQVLRGKTSGIDNPTSRAEWADLARRAKAAEAQVIQCVRESHPGDYDHEGPDGERWNDDPSEPEAPTAVIEAATDARDAFQRLVKARLHGTDTEQAQAWDAAYLAHDRLTVALTDAL